MMRRGGAGGPGAQSGEGGPGAPSAGAGSASATSQRQDWGMVWKLRPDKSLEPARVKLGVTDFTFTAMEEGNLKPGDDLVIGQSTSKNSNPTQQPGQRSGPMGGPGGIPRRM